MLEGNIRGVNHFGGGMLLHTNMVRLSGLSLQVPTPEKAGWADHKRHGLPIEFCRLNVEIADVEGVVFDEFTAALDVLAHEG